MAKKPPATPADPKDKAKDPDAEVLALARKRFSAAADAEDENRRNYLDDLKFSCSNDQWDEQVKRLRGRNRPALTFNRLNGVVKQIIGDYRQNKMSIKVLPADGDASEEAAEILGGLIRNIEAQSNADVAYTTGFECALRGGFGYWRVLPQYTGDDVFEQDLVIRPIPNPLTVYFDPAAKLITREDANWCFVTDYVSKEQFKADYPDVKPSAFDTKAEWATEWYRTDDVRIAEYFEKARYSARLGAFSNGLVMAIEDDAEIYAMEQIGLKLVREREAERTKIVWRKMIGDKLLDTQEYKTKYIPVIRVSCEEVNIEGKVKTRSAIYYAKDSQRNYNYWKSTATEAVALSPKAKTLLTPEQIQGHQDMWDNAHTSPIPYLLYNGEPGQGNPQPMQAAQPPLAELSMAGNSSDDIKATTGIYDASLGARSNETSGRAIVARQQEGANATFIFTDNQKTAIEYTGKVLIDWIPVTHDTERVIRTLDLEGNPKTLTINQQQHDRLTGITQILNSITVGKYDVVVTAGPSFANRKAEAVAGMSQLVQAYPPLMQMAGDLLVKNLDWPGASEIAERLKRTIPPALTEDKDSPEAKAAEAQQQQMQQAQQEQAMQLQQGKIDAENAKSQATVAKAQADIVKARGDTIQSVAGTREALAPSRPTAPSQPAMPVQHSPVSIQFNAEEPLNRVAATMEEFVVHQAESTTQVMQVIQGVLQANAESSRLLAESIHRQQDVEQQQAELMRENAVSMQAVAAAIENQNQIAKAPRVAVRDKQGNIVSSEIRL